MGSCEKNCYEASVNPEFGSTLARRLNQSCFPTVLQSNQITIKFGTAEARRLNWALQFPCTIATLQYQNLLEIDFLLIKQFECAP